VCKNGRKIEVGGQGAESIERRAQETFEKCHFFVIPAKAGIHYIPPLKGVRGMLIAQLKKKGFLCDLCVLCREKGDNYV